MNRLYGIWIPKAFKSEENWYKINRYGTRRLFFWSVVYIVIGILNLLLPPIGGKTLVWFIGIGSIVYICTIPFIEILLYARKL